jgi:hypothetical protein
MFPWFSHDFGSLETRIFWMLLSFVRFSKNCRETCFKIFIRSKSVGIR